MLRPFLILALPRSRTFWLSKFLTYRDWHCGHDELRHVRTLADVQSWLSQPMTGSAETAAAPFWRLIPPDVRIVIVRRPVPDVVKSMMATMPEGVFDRNAMTSLMTRLDLKLSQVSKRLPNTLTLSFDSLKDEAACAQVFEYCLPYSHDHKRWRILSGINLQISIPVFMRYIIAHQPQIAGAAAQAKGVTLLKMKGGQKWHSL